jgi:hypothetical protein
MDVPGFKSLQVEPTCPDQYWKPHSLLLNGYQELFPLGYGNQSIRLTTQLHLVLRLRMNGGIPPFPPIAFTASTGTT